MSYIIKSEQPFTSVKLTETGREKLAKGQLNFSTWAIGDSEINYDRQNYIQGGILTGDTSVILRPKDKQPNLKYFVNKGTNTNNFAFGVNDIRCIKLTVNNEAEQRGPFNGDSSTGFTTNTNLSGYTKGSGTVTSLSVTGGTIINLGVSGINEGDVLLLKLGYNDFSNDIPTPHLFYRIEFVAGNELTVDRELPNLSSGNVAYVIYNGGNIYDNEPDSIAYWDTGTLSFDSSCDITTMDVPLWNMNIPFSEDIMGITGFTHETHIDYGSYNYLGQKNNYLYSLANNVDLPSVAIIHYSNKTISNLYGENFYIDNDTKNVKIHLPNLIYHRSNLNSGTTMGMTFISSGVEVSTGANGLTYIPLIEESTLVSDTPIEVGRVYPALKIITIHDSEIIAAMSYKSNRNWTLPKLNLTLTNPSTGVGTGLLGVGKKMFITYQLNNESGNGITPTLPCQNYSTIINDTATSKDVQFNIEDLDLLTYMRNDNVSGGFYADTFKIIYQITDGERPTTDAWKVLDFTSSVESGGFVNVSLLETQNPLALTPNFTLNSSNASSATTFSLIADLALSPISNPQSLQFGDERFFYGNIETFIGATIFKTIFKITINASDFTNTTNITRSSNPQDNPPNIVVSEVGIYDSIGDLVIIGKLSQPVQLTSGKTVILELGIDF